jgi:TPP-dependent trihydroxycyclohexane-1,2-dione (THcHDO) dehydratase
LAYERAQTIPALRAALERALAPQTGSTLVHVKTDRAANVKLHGRVWDAVSRACEHSATDPASAGDEGASA